MSRQTRPTSQLPKPPLTLSPSVIIGDNVTITGIYPITIGANAVIHPRAKLISTYGPITISDGCIISEKASVGLLSALTSNSLHSVSQSSIESEDAESSGEGEETPGVHLDTNVIIEPAATVEASRIGKGSSIDASAKVMKGAVLGERCKVAACCVVKEGEVLEAWTVVYGDGTLRRKERSGLEALRDAAHQKQLEVLRRLIPSNVGKWMS